MNRIQTVIGSATLASLLMVLPLFASAETLHAKGSTGVVVSPNGIVHVIGANVTAVSNGVVNAMTKIGDFVMNWVVNVSASTKVLANGSNHATTTDIKVGEKVSFKGTLSSTTSSVLTVAATKIRDLTSFPIRRFGTGTVASVNTVNGSFVLTGGDKSVTVQTNASTTISLHKSTTTFASITTGKKVWVAGVPNADGSVITATMVVIHDPEVTPHRTNDDKGDKKDGNKHENKHEHEKKVSGNVKADAHTHVEGNGKSTHLKLLGGLHFGIGRND